MSEWYDLWSLRNKSNEQDFQNVVGAGEHAAYAKARVKERPLWGLLEQAVAIPAYTLAKATGLVSGRSEPSLNEVGAGYAGLMSGVQENIGDLFTGNKEGTSVNPRTRIALAAQAEGRAAAEERRRRQAAAAKQAMFQPNGSGNMNPMFGYNDLFGKMTAQTPTMGPAPDYNQPGVLADAIVGMLSPSEKGGDYVLDKTGSPGLATAVHAMHPGNVLKGLGDFGKYAGGEVAQASMDAGMPPELTGVLGAGTELVADPSNLLPGFGKAAAGAAGLAGVGMAAKRGGKGLPPDIRGLSTEKALPMARREPHLRTSGEAAEGKYLGGPRDARSKQWLNKRRGWIDDQLDRNPAGGDWYDRYRADVDRVTGGSPGQRDPQTLWDQEFMARQEGQWSAGQDPGSEFAASIKANNGVLTGFRDTGGRPALRQAHQRAADLNDPSRYLRGPKTGEYGDHITPSYSLQDSATGVNDFRHAITLGYTEPGGLPQRTGLTSAQHRFADYETALMVDRANQRGLGGRTNWTGEQIQAVPWVIQKADDLYGAGNSYKARAKTELTHERANDLSDAAIEARAKAMAFADANRTIGDYFPKHTANATYESMPGPGTGHLPGLSVLGDSERAAIHADPRSTFATAPGGRDSIYSGLRFGDTGIAGRVQPTVQSQGIYQPAGGGPLEMNPGEVARPLVGINRSGTGLGTLPDGDRAMLDAGETWRAAIGGQEAGAAHLPTVGGRVGEQRSVRLPMDRKLQKDELQKVRGVFAEAGLGDTIDTGRGVTGTSFLWDDVLNAPAELPELPGKKLGAVAEELRAALPGAGAAQRVNVDSVYADLSEEWLKGEGSGAVAQKMLDKVNVTPEMRAAFDNNPYIGENAINYLERDADLAKKFGSTVREDLQNLRRIIGGGPGRIAKIEKGIKAGTLPAIAAAFLGVAMAGGEATSDEVPSEL